MKMHRRLGSWICVSIMAFLAVFVSLSLAAVASSKTSYTVMVFMNGSDLESEGGSAANDLLEMMQVGSGDGVNVVVETLGTHQWQQEKVQSDRNQRWLIGEESMTLMEDNLGPRRLDDPETLTDFIVWSMRNFPAEKYVLIFWDHGAGSVDGFGADELHDNTSLNLAGIQEGIADALRVTRERFELIGFDTCLMSTLEVAAILSPFANYMVASEELEPGHGWNYIPVLQALRQSKELKGDRLGTVIVDGYKAQAEEYDQDENITLSVVDLSKVDEVVEALEQFVGVMGSDIGDVDRIRLIAQARSKAESYGNSSHDASDMVDLGDLARQAMQTYPDEARLLTSRIADAVVHKVGSPGTPRSTGLSIYFPFKDKANLERKLTKYIQHTPFSDVYKTFVADFAESLFADSEPIEFAVDMPTWVPKISDTAIAVQIAPQYAQEIAAAYSLVTTFEEEGSSRLLFLAMDNDVLYDPEEGLLLGDFTGGVVTLNDHYVAMFIENEGDDFDEYSIPVKLNGKEVDLIVLYNYKTDEAKLIGAWDGIDPESHMAVKNIIKIKPGDRITPQFYYYDVDTDEEGFLDGDEFVVTGPLELGYTELPAGRYLYGFYVLDYAGNEAVSEFAEVTVVNE